MVKGGQLGRWVWVRPEQMTLYQDRSKARGRVVRVILYISAYRYVRGGEYNVVINLHVCCEYDNIVCCIFITRG